jgi:hypothetical protein
MKKRMAEIREMRRSEAWSNTAKKYKSASIINEEFWPLMEQVELENMKK